MSRALRPMPPLILSAIVIALSACGGGDDDEDSAGQGPPTEASVRSCLEDGGADIVTVTPTGSGVLDFLAIGPGGGRIDLVFTKDPDLADSIGNGLSLGSKPLSVSTVNDGKTVIAIEPDPDPDDEALASKCAGGD